MGLTSSSSAGASGQRPIGPRPPTPGILLADSGNITLGGWRAPAPAPAAESWNLTSGGWRASAPAPAAEIVNFGDITLGNWRPPVPPLSKDRWVIENNKLSGVIAGERVQVPCNLMQQRWMYYNIVPEQSRLLRWQSEQEWVRRAILICVLGREPFGKEFVDPFTNLNYKELQMRMQMQDKEPSVILRGYQCNQSSLDRTSTICKPLK